MGLRDRWLGDTTHRSDQALLVALRAGSPPTRIRAARELARRGRTDVLRALLTDLLPGVRRAAARGLGWQADPPDAPILCARISLERCDTVRIAVSAAAVRCGSDVRRIGDEARRSANRQVGTFAGPRIIAPPYDLARGLADELGTAGTRAAAAIELAALADPEGADGLSRLRRLAAFDPVGLAARRDLLARTAGRRFGYGLIELSGLIGDPADAPALVALLAEPAVDPARGFAQRRAAALALGRIGDPRAARPLIAAWHAERVEHEGRPGAGLGIQFPVRTVIAWALGEIQAAVAIPTLAANLGSVATGLHLPVMNALIAIGPACLPAVGRRLGEPEATAANAAGVIGALGPSEWRDRALADSRAAVSAAAAAAQAPADPIGEALAAWQDRRFYDAHEILEHEWRGAVGARRVLLQALIQGAVSLEHLHRGNPTSAAGQWRKAEAKLAGLEDVAEGVDVGRWRRDMTAFVTSIRLAERASGVAVGPLPPIGAWPAPVRAPG